MRELLWAALSEALTKAWETKRPTPDLEDSMLTFLESSEADDDRLQVLQTLYVRLGLSERGVLRLLRWSERLRAEGAAPRLRVEAIRNLAGRLGSSREDALSIGRPELVKPPPAALLEHLNRLAEDDPCDACRAGSIGGRRSDELGRLPVFLRVLEKGVCDAPLTAGALSRVLGKAHRMREALDGFVNMLDCNRPLVQYYGVWGIARLLGEDEWWHGNDREWLDRLEETRLGIQGSEGDLGPEDREKLEAWVKEMRRRATALKGEGGHPD